MRVRRNPFLRRGGLVHAVAVAVVVVDAIGKHWALTVVGDAPLTLPGLAFHITLDDGVGVASPGWFGDGTIALLVVLDVLLIGSALLAAPRIEVVPFAVAAGLGGGAAACDLIDRLARPPGALRGALVHWIDPAWSPAFNVADIALVVAVALAASLLRTRPSA